MGKPLNIVVANENMPSGFISYHYHDCMSAYHYAMHIFHSFRRDEIYPVRANNWRRVADKALATAIGWASK